jgi:hypothetical protein
MKIKELYEKVNDGKIISDIELQREIVYSPEKQKLVIDSIVNGIPLPAFYFWKNEEGILEVLDGKQRIEAIKKFYQNDIEYNGKIWKEYAFDPEFQKKINETEISDIVCSGTEELKREIFRRINTLGVALSKFEVLNGLYNGEYLRGVTAYVKQDSDILKVLGSNNRGANQYWIIEKIIELKNVKNIEVYVKKNQDISFETDQKLITKHIKFIRGIFEKYNEKEIYFRLSVKYLIDFGAWKDKKTEINRKISEYLKDRTLVALTNKEKEIEDIIQAVLNYTSVDPKRLFTRDDKEELLRKENQEDGKYRCKICKQLFFSNELEVDHIFAWSKGGRTELSNAQLLCRPCNAKKNNL